MPKGIEPSEKLKKEMYEFYTKIFDSSFDHQKKKNLLTSITGWEPWSWRVVGITANAVGTIVENDGHARVKSQLVRDHFFQSRSKTSNNLLSKKYDYTSYWREFWDNDRTIIMTKFEHSYVDKIELTGLTKENSESFLFNVEWENGLFKSEKVAGFHFTYRDEGKFILNNFKNRIIQKKWPRSFNKINNQPEFYYSKIN